MNLIQEIRKIKNAICCIYNKLLELDEVIFFSYEGTNDLSPLAVPGLSGKLYVNIDTGESFIANPTGLAPYYTRVSDGINRPIEIQLSASDLTTALTAGTTKAYCRVPSAFTLTSVRASLATAQASGSIFTVDINMNGTSIISTKLTIDNTEKTSVTAATPAVISTSAITDDAEITIDIDQVGNGTAKGLIITLIGTR